MREHGLRVEAIVGCIELFPSLFEIVKVVSVVVFEVKLIKLIFNSVIQTSNNISFILVKNNLL